MKLHTLSTLTLASVLVLGAAGCKKKMDRVTPLPGYGAGATIRDPGPGGPGNGLTGTGPGTGTGTDANPGGALSNPNGVAQTGARSIDGRPQDRTKFEADRVQFEYDRANVRAGEATKVQDVATRFKNEDPGTDLLIEGHCDEKGTEEYNRSLGERRALALRELLIASGVSADRLHTVSFGKDKPIDTGHSEASHAKNRRGEFILVLPK